MILLAASTLAVASARAQTAPKPDAPPAQAPTRARANTRAGGSFDALAKRAAEAREAGRLEEAVGLYEKALKQRPSWTEGHWYLGTIQYELDRYSPARDAFRRVILADPKHGGAYAMKGLCEFRLENYDAALEDLLKASEIGLGASRDLTDVVRYHTAILLTRRQEFEFALLQLEPIAQSGNDSPSVIEAMGIAVLRIPLLPSELPPERREMVLLAGRGAYYQAARVTTAADRAYRELVQRYPDSPNTHYVYGTFLLQSDPAKAIEELEKELKISPGHVPAILQIAFEYIKQSNWEAARPWAEEAVAIAPDNFAAHRAIGQVLLETGDVEKAVDHLERGVRLAPDSPSMHFMLARAYQRAGRTEDAARERLEFRRLERLVRTGRHGRQAVGGIEVVPEETEGDQPQR
ncbi:MAG TPA: tetratricopeptide repeat protein [Vicinamibacterales bacterium]